MGLWHLAKKGLQIAVCKLRFIFVQSMHSITHVHLYSHKSPPTRFIVRSVSTTYIAQSKQYSAPWQGPKLRLTGRQCDQKFGVNDQNFRTGRQQATNLLSHRHLKFQVKGLFFFKENKKLQWTIVSKRSDDFTIAIFTWRHIVSVASPNTDIAGENVTCRDRKRRRIHMHLVLYTFPKCL